MRSRSGSLVMFAAIRFQLSGRPLRKKSLDVQAGVEASWRPTRPVMTKGTDRPQVVRRPVIHRSSLSCEVTKLLGRNITALI